LKRKKSGRPALIRANSQTKEETIKSLENEEVSVYGWSSTVTELEEVAVGVDGLCSSIFVVIEYRETDGID